MNGSIFLFPQFCAAHLSQVWISRRGAYLPMVILVLTKLSLKISTFQKNFK